MKHPRASPNVRRFLIVPRAPTSRQIVSGDFLFTLLAIKNARAPILPNSVESETQRLTRKFFFRGLVMGENFLLLSTRHE